MICTWCHQNKDLSRFYKRPFPRKTIQSGCIDCRNTYSEKWVAKHPIQRSIIDKTYNCNNPVKRRSYISKNKWKRKGIDMTQERYEALLIHQNGACAICKVKANTLRRCLDVDHNHTTGKTRGLLCSRCNALIVMVIEKYSFLVPTTMEYLRKYEYEATNVV